MTIKFMRRVVALAVAAIVGVGLLPGAAAAHHPEYPQRFFVVADNCWMGYAEGVVTWRAVHPPTPVAVDIRGNVFDRFRYEGGGCQFFCPPEVCDDGRFTTVTFTGYAGRLVVDRRQSSVDNGMSEFRLTLGTSFAPTSRPIDRVVIQVCRSPVRASDTASYCGPAREFFPVP